MNVLVQANPESLPGVLDGRSYQPNSRKIYEVLPSYHICHGFAEGALTPKMVEFLVLAK